MRVSVSETGRFDGPESGALWGLDPNTDVLVRPPATSMQLKDFFDLTKSSNESANFEIGNIEEEKVKEIFYLEYLALSQYLGKVLWKDHFVFLNLIDIMMFIAIITSFYLGQCYYFTS